MLFTSKKKFFFQIINYQADCVRFEYYFGQYISFNLQRINNPDHYNIRDSRPLSLYTAGESFIPCTATLCFVKNLNGCY